ncbi:hypothetical protein [Streptomyces sp. NPDC052496]|uniref:hypothetical protein n=1 Tax=Streptomyces sp. NPDC052496 TaxID=3154951 RepID=UPI003428E6B4
MSAVSALPAAVRLSRAAVVRRALLAGLFLAGFVALGFAFGGGAHAADRPAGMEPQAGAVTATGPQTSVKASATDAGRGLERGGATAADTVDTVAETPVGKAVQPVAERTAPVAGQATEPVTAPVRDVVREVRHAAGADSLPVGLPGRIPGVDGNGDGDGASEPGDGHDEQQPSQDSGQRPGTVTQHAGTGAGDRPDAVRADTADCTPRWARTGGLRDTSSRAAQRAGVPGEQQPGQGRGGLPGPFPQGPAPSASHTAGDGHGPRGADQFAAVPVHPAHFGLVPGGVLAAAEPPTRQRAADILEFPG